MLGHKESISKFKEIKIASSIFSDHDVMRLYIKYKKTTKNTNTWLNKATKQPINHLRNHRGNRKIHREE